MNAHPGDQDGVPGTVYVLHFEPGYRHARHYVGWTAGDVATRVAMHLQGCGSPLIRAAIAAGADVKLVATYPGSRGLERRLKRWHKTSQFCPACRRRPTASATTSLEASERPR
jgi:hypothetical protein